MTPAELLKECQRVTLQGLSRMVLTIPRRRLRSNRVRIMPGLTATVCGGQGDRLHVWVEIDDVIRCLERLEREHTPPSPLVPPRDTTNDVCDPIPPCDLPSGPMAHDGDEPEAADGSS